MKYNAYHGRTVNSSEFSLKYVGRDEAIDQFGPGFYFTDVEHVAVGYAGSDGIVINADIIINNPISDSTDATEAEIMFMIKNAPAVIPIFKTNNEDEQLEAFYDSPLSDFSEYPGDALDDAVSTYTGGPLYDAMMTIWRDFYKYNPGEFLINLIKLGYDGYIDDKGEQSVFVVYNPKNIKILNIVKSSTLTESINRNNLKLFIQSHKRNSNKLLLESIITGFNTIFESREVGKSLNEYNKFKYLNNVVIYRARDKNGKTFEPNDYVTLSPNFAIEHAESNHVYNDESQIVIRAKVNPSDVFEAGNPGEYFYKGPSIEGVIAYVTLGDNYDYETPDITRTDIQLSLTESSQSNTSSTITLYRGLESKFDPKHDLNNTDAPNGYSTWTDNPELARQYAGEDGYVYQIELPLSELGNDVVDADGDRTLYFDNGKRAGVHGVSGKEYLVYNYHDLFNVNSITQSDVNDESKSLYIYNDDMDDGRNIILYCGLGDKLDSMLSNLHQSGDPSDYSRWYVNPKAAIYNAGSGGYVYKIKLPLSELGDDVINDDGDRVLFYKGTDMRSYDGDISSDSYYVYNDHDNFNPNDITLVNEPIFESENNEVVGGKADNMTLSDIAKLHNVDISQILSEFKMGVKVEMEHTDDPEVAIEIAMDHLVEIPDYYTRLEKMESEAGIIEAGNPMRPSRPKLDLKNASHKTRVMFGILSAYRHMGEHARKKFEYYMPKGIDIAIYSLDELSEHSLITLKEMATKIRNWEKAIIAADKKKNKKPTKKEEKEMAEYYEQRDLENARDRWQSALERKRMIEDGEYDETEIQNMLDAEIIDEDGNPLDVENPDAIDLPEEEVEDEVDIEDDSGVADEEVPDDINEEIIEEMDEELDEPISGGIIDGGSISKSGNKHKKPGNVVERSLLRSGEGGSKIAGGVGDMMTGLRELKDSVTGKKTEYYNPKSKSDKVRGSDIHQRKSRGRIK